MAPPFVGDCVAHYIGVRGTESRSEWHGSVERLLTALGAFEHTAVTGGETYLSPLVFAPSKRKPALPK